ncbi:very-short-patch-repair endonuclease [Bacillus sp. NRRL B-14911]|uniref:Very short patch repair endonuclease n=1 Tax=Bacillus infantis NRRL B-14911 TaxID=1367477 RepID=U5L502_9BACI|nr:MULTISPECIES: very short patch repair endonuclease [Bacillus]AGX02769.1 DNA mismatch repair protein Vsr [Bacillus infantis NRRL B-14911]EAR67208.1 very-short-patch-repair endonuclease [Bacillus sp. NRRL B-14911]
MKNPKTSDARSKIMGSIKAVSKLEDMVTHELWNRGYRFRRNVRSLKGTPDIAIKKYKVVIFIDSCFWHLCPIHGKIPKSNVEFWSNKLHRNQERDKEVTDFYINRDWNILRLWEHEIRGEFENTVDTISEFISESKKKE